MGMVSEARTWKRKNEKLGSDLVVQRSRYHNFEVFFRALQDGHSFSGIWGGTRGGVKSDKIGKVFLQKLGSDLVVQGSR